MANAAHALHDHASGNSHAAGNPRHIESGAPNNADLIQPFQICLKRNSIKFYIFNKLLELGSAKNPLMISGLNSIFSSDIFMVLAQ